MAKATGRGKNHPRRYLTPAFDISAEAEVYLDLNDVVFEAFTYDKIVEIHEEHNGVIFLRGECYLINTIDIDFI